MALTILIDASALGDEGTSVEVVPTKDGWSLHRDGVPYEVKGVGGGDSDLDRVRASGVTTIRTWGIEPETGKLLDAAHSRGLTVLVGLWMGHIGDGFDYNDADAVAAQEAELVALAEPLKSHPALLGWGIGNEVEFEHDVPEVWQAIGSLASAIKSMDPNHPTVAVTAELGSANEDRLAQYCPDIDIWGINTYAALVSLPNRLTARGWDGPYLITEYGHRGPWESTTTAWGAPLEPSSRTKAYAYTDHWNNVISTDPRCLGGFPFIWRPGASPSDTWFPMLTWDGRGTESTDSVLEIFTGTNPGNRAPTVGGIIGDVAGEVFSPGDPIVASVSAVDPEGAPLDVEWFLARETVDTDGRWTGTSATSRCLEGSGTTLSMTAPNDPGPYRLLAFVGDGGPSVGTASAPFLVESTPTGYAATPTFAVADHFSPTGWMGDTSRLGLTSCVAPSDACGGICHQISWTPTSSNWFGILWQHPPNNWGGAPGLSVAPGADRVGFYAWSDPPSDATFRVGGGNDGFTTQLTFSLGTEPAWYELPIDPNSYTDVSTGFGILADGPTPRTISVSTPTWMAKAPIHCEGDLNGDDVIGPSDLGLLLGAWNESASSFPLGDLSGNGVIDAADLGLLIGRWGPCPEG